MYAHLMSPHCANKTNRNETTKLPLMLLLFLLIFFYCVRNTKNVCFAILESFELLWGGWGGGNDIHTYCNSSYNDVTHQTSLTEYCHIISNNSHIYIRSYVGRCALCIQ